MCLFFVRILLSSDVLGVVWGFSWGCRGYPFLEVFQGFLAVLYGFLGFFQGSFFWVSKDVLEGF